MPTSAWQPWLETWLHAVGSDAENAHVGRFSRFVVDAWTTEGERYVLGYDGGVVRLEHDDGPPGSATHHREGVSDVGSQEDRLVLRAPRDVWRELADPSAAPRRHDLLSLTKADDGIEIVTGREVMIRHLRVLTRLVELAKGVGSEPSVRDARAKAGQGAAPRFEDVVGRYLRLRSGGAEHRIYVEMAGPDDPDVPVLLALHTAGADSRQYRHLLADPAVTDRWRVIAFDLPAHGRSLPPPGWWRREYLLTTETYATLVEDVASALGLDRPVVLGCSMGGSLVLELARRDPDRWGGVIGLSGALSLTGRFQDWPLHPDVNAQHVVPSWTASLMAPNAPEESRREVWWIYSQGGPGIYRGDTYFYSEDLDLRETAATIDTARCPVYLLTGEYDHACTPADTDAARAAIPGARGGTMRGIGHFPMAENYPLFRTYLLPVLAELAATVTHRDAQARSAQEE
ncbi:alpha/beta fold hydrolase [Georgenia alba]|uniref:Alpha/beta fold hydrolase n=1 Tax=Georgenia alba TaxID=2233858 RepID=A0ABW2Q6Q2_9MICO